jgi:MerR family transcriptional regulator, light-induced transcriptional regulator
MSDKSDVAENTPETVLYNQREKLAAEVIKRQWENNPDFELKYGKIGRAKCREDTEYHFLYLFQALSSNSFFLFREYLGWVKILLLNLHLSVNDFIDNLKIIREVIREHLPADKSQTALSFLTKGIEILPELPEQSEPLITQKNPYYKLASSYFQNLLAGKREEALSVIMNAYHSGVPIKDLYMHVFQPVQMESGRLWQTNKISVAQEHFCTAATQLVMSRLYPYLFTGERKDLTFMGTCVGRELHEIGIRMISDYFEMEGWNSYYIGANIPNREVVKAVKEYQPDLLGLSTTITYHIKEVKELIETVREDEECGNTKIIVGGLPFNRDPELWKAVGADATAVTAEEAIQIANRLIEERDVE